MKRKNSVFIGMSSGFGPLAQIMPIADELKKYDYESFCFILRFAGEMIKTMDLRFLELPEIPTAKTINPKSPYWWNQDYFWTKYGYMDYEYVKALVENYTNALLDIKPKVVISSLHPVSAIVARRLKIPLVCVTQSCTHPNGKGGRTTWWKEMPQDLDSSTPVVNRVLQEIGMEPIERMEELNVGDLTIVPSIPEFDVIEDKDAFYTGPMFWQGPDRLTKDQYKIERKNKYLVHIYTGHLLTSVGKAAGLILLENAVKAFNNTEFDVIITTGTGQKVPEYIKPSDNVKIIDWLPLNDVIPKCDIDIHHGGHGSSLQCLGHGVPSIVIPTMDEREYNARQLHELGVSLYITPEELTPGLLLEKARTIVRTPEFKNNAKALAENIRHKNFGGAPEAAKQIVGLVSAFDKEESNAGKTFG